MIYIAGPVTGYEDDNRPAFEEARRRLIAAEAGEEVLIPHEVVPEGTPWEEAMCLCVRALTRADEVVCLPGSQYSRGAKLEAQIARALGIPVYGLEQYLER